jgi:thiol-disulfide isomerase/thioredoxin
MRAFFLGALTLLQPFATEHATAPLKPPVIDPLSQRAPAFEYRSLDGTVHRLSELKGKVVVIDFWGTWCPGCVEEMPTLQRLYEVYRSNPNVAFVIVSQNDTPEKIKAFVEKNHLTIPIYYIGSNLPPNPLSPSAWPATYFVSPDGMLRGVHLGGADWSDSSVKKYIERLEQQRPVARSK